MGLEIERKFLVADPRYHNSSLRERPYCEWRVAP